MNIKGAAQILENELIKSVDARVESEIEARLDRDVAQAIERTILKYTFSDDAVVTLGQLMTAFARSRKWVEDLIAEFGVVPRYCQGNLRDRKTGEPLMERFYDYGQVRKARDAWLRNSGRFQIGPVFGISGANEKPKKNKKEVKFDNKMCVVR